ncbi:hypothetical protein STEG23_016818, partial [Scotinomys teguina]
CFFDSFQLLLSTHPHTPVEYRIHSTMGENLKIILDEHNSIHNTKHCQWSCQRSSRWQLTSECHPSGGKSLKDESRIELMLDFCVSKECTMQQIDAYWYNCGMTIMSKELIRFEACSEMMFSVLDKIFNISEFYIAESYDVFNSLAVNIKTHIQCDFMPHPGDFSAHCTTPQVHLPRNQLFNGLCLFIDVLFTNTT